MAITNLITNGDFSTGESNNWGNWVTAGAFATGGANETAPTLIADDSAASVTYAGLSGLDNGGGTNGAGQVTLDVAWQNAGGSSNASTLEVRVAGVLVATITTLHYVSLDWIWSWNRSPRNSPEVSVSLRVYHFGR